MYRKEFMDLAIKIAREGIETGCGGPFGCVIVKEDKILAATHNTVVKDNDPTAHGEVNAIREACKKIGSFDLSGCILYTTSEPCPMCLSAIMWARISKVYSAMNIQDASKIGFDDEPFYKAIKSYANKEENQFVSVEFIREKDCEKLFEDYKNMDSIKY